MATIFDNFKQSAERTQLRRRRQLQKAKSLANPFGKDSLGGGPFEGKNGWESLKQMKAAYEGKNSANARKDLFLQRIKDGLNTLSSTSPSYARRKQLGASADADAKLSPPKAAKEANTLFLAKIGLQQIHNDQEVKRRKKYVADMKVAWNTMRVYFQNKANIALENGQENTYDKFNEILNSGGSIFYGFPKGWLTYMLYIIQREKIHNERLKAGQPDPDYVRRDFPGALFIDYWRRRKYKYAPYEDDFKELDRSIAPPYPLNE